MSNCPTCGMPMKKETREILEGILIQVEVCQKCKDEWIDEIEHDRLIKAYKRRKSEDEDELTEGDIKDIAEARADIKAGRFHTAEEVYRELGLTGRTKTLEQILAECGDDEEEKDLIRQAENLDDSGWEGPINGHVVEIRKVDEDDNCRRNTYMDFVIFIEQEEDTFVATAKDFNRFVSKGNTRDEALFKIKEVVQGYLNDVNEGLQKNGLEKYASQRQPFFIVIEKTGNNYSAYSPDLPGCVAAGATRDEAEENITEAIGKHLHQLLISDVLRRRRDVSRILG